MSRRLRRIIPGIPYHVTHRGNHREAILSDDECRAIYVSIMRQWQHRTNVQVAAFVLMPNHVHFICVSPTETALSRWIQHGHREYSKWLNTERGAGGHNWEGRFFSVPMDDEHCLNALRYVEQNPVAARMVQRAWDWRWSSAAHHCGLGPQPSLLDLDLRPAGMTAPAWRQALLEPSAADFRARLHECMAQRSGLGSDGWAESLKAAHGVDVRAPRRGRPPKQR